MSQDLAQMKNWSKEIFFNVEDIDCGLGLMKLACNVTVHASPAYWGDKFYVEYEPESHPTSNKIVRSKTFAVSSNESVGVQIFRLRAQTNYSMTLVRVWVTNSNQVKERSHKVIFKTAATGYDRFDEGPINIVTGTPDYPLLNFALHTTTFRGVVATDSDGYVVWYYNASVADTMAHIIAVEQSDKEHIWCINDGGYMDVGVSIRIIDAMGTTLAVKSESEVTGMSGHECRFTDGIDNPDDTQRVILLTSTTTHLNQSYRGHGYPRRLLYNKESYYTTYKATEAIRIYDAYENGVRLVQNISLDPFLSYKDLLTFNAFQKESLGFNSTDDNSTNNALHEWNDLILEFTDIDVDTLGSIHYEVRYIHGSSVSVSEDGSLYVVTFRNSHIVVGIDRKTHSKKFLLSSVIDNLATHKFENDFHKFYAPHDVSYHSNNTVCLIDDGYYRPQGQCAIHADNSGCYSRAVCYSLDDDAGVVRLEWEFEFPYEFEGAPTNTSRITDLYNLLGGSLRRIGVTEWVASFTAVDDAVHKNSSWSFGLKQNSEHGVDITSIVQMPVCDEWNSVDGVSGSYRATPLISINGETEV